VKIKTKQNFSRCNIFQLRIVSSRKCQLRQIANKGNIQVLKVWGNAAKLYIMALPFVLLFVYFMHIAIIQWGMGKPVQKSSLYSWNSKLQWHVIRFDGELWENVPHLPLPLDSQLVLLCNNPYPLPIPVIDNMFINKDQMTTISIENHVFLLHPPPPHHPPTSAESVIMAAFFLLSLGLSSLCVTYSKVQGGGANPNVCKKTWSSLFTFSNGQDDRRLNYILTLYVYCSKVNMFFYMLESSFFVFLSSSSKRAKKKFILKFSFLVKAFIFATFPDAKLHENTIRIFYKKVKLP
jgi:hypothetical protein